jgi:hypothetical protein
MRSTGRTSASARHTASARQVRVVSGSRTKKGCRPMPAGTGLLLEVLERDADGHPVIAQTIGLARAIAERPAALSARALHGHRRSLRKRHRSARLPSMRPAVAMHGVVDARPVARELERSRRQKSAVRPGCDWRTAPADRGQPRCPLPEATAAAVIGRSTSTPSTVKRATEPPPAGAKSRPRRPVASAKRVIGSGIALAARFLQSRPRGGTHDRRSRVEVGVEPA